MTHYTQSLKSYQQVAAQTASRGQLVLMLYDGAIRFLGRALAAFGEDDPLERNMTIHNNITRAQEILHELNISLNMEAEGKFSETMRALYEYMDRRLMEANLQKSDKEVHEVVHRLTILRNAWSDMLQGKTIAPAAPEQQMRTPIMAAA